MTARMAKERFTRVDGLRIRSLEEGSGPAVLFLHGASLGSSADVWSGNLPAFAARGFRAIAFDLPGFGLSDNPQDPSLAYRRDFVLAFMDALGLDRAHLVGHSQAGRIAVGLGFARPERIAKVVVLGTGSLLPPLAAGGKAQEGGEGEESGAVEPTLEQTRAALEDDLFERALITPVALETRHRMSVGKNFEAFLARARAPRPDKEATPLWRRLGESPVPLLLIYGRQDRAAAERAELARRHHPGLDLRVLDRCKHLVQWDAAAEFAALSTRFFAA